MAGVSPIHLPPEDRSMWEIDPILDLATNVVLHIPVVLRASGIAVFFLMCWGVNVYVFDRAGIPFRKVMGFGATEAQSTVVFAAVRQLLLLLGACVFLYEVFSRSDNAPGKQVLQVAFWFIVLGLCLFSQQPHYVKLRSFCHERIRAFFSFKDVRFVDVLMADVLTSMSKLLADLQVVVCAAVSLLSIGRGGAGSDACMSSLVGPILASVPFTVRAVQCWVGYRDTGSTHHLVNLGKYLSSFPVIWTSALKHQLAPVEGVALDKHDQHLQYLWLYTVTINSMYSFLWDVIMDWGLCRDPRSSYPLLRRDIRFPALTYYLAIVGDLGLRLCWSLKLSSHLQRHATGQAFVFLFEVLEVLRRFGWTFLRVEWECIQKLGRAESIAERGVPDGLADGTKRAEGP